MDDSSHLRDGFSGVATGGRSGFDDGVQDFDLAHATIAAEGTLRFEMSAARRASTR